MNLYMTGIDFNTADIEYRERFALTQTTQAAAMEEIRNRPDVSGCVIISTCNRMELWINYNAPAQTRPFDILSQVLGLHADDAAAHFTHRAGDEAVRHLFELACGLKSMIFGEEQILTQVRQSVAFARECGASDAVLHALFRYAVTSAKKVKTNVRLTAVDRSVAGITVRMLKERLGSLKDLPCLVIGSGEIGRLAVKGLLSEGCEVTMTLRQFKSGDAVIPAGSNAIRYEDRYKMYPKAKVIISATRSPHYTLCCDAVRQLGGGEKILFDLAVPRDIDPCIARLENVELYDIDHLGGSLVDSEDAGVLEARAIIDGEINAFHQWRKARSLMPILQEIGAAASADVQARIKYRLKNTQLDENDRRIIDEVAGEAVSKVVEKILLTLQKDTDGRLFEQCVGSLDTGRPSAENELPLRFPLYVDLSGRNVLVVGAGPIAARRVASLLPFDCRITVVAPEACDEITRHSKAGRLCLKRRPYETADSENAYLIVAATDDRALNHRIAGDAGEKGCYCSVADCKEECTFFFPAVVPYDGGVIGICGTGEDHGRTKRLKAQIKDFMSKDKS